MNYILSGFADEITENFIDQIIAFKELDINYIELRFADGVNISDFNEVKQIEIKKALKQYEIKVSAIGSPIGKIGIDDDFDSHLIKARKIFKFADELGCKLIRIFSFYIGSHKREEIKDKVIERLRTLYNEADKYGLILCIENEEGLYCESPESFLEILSELKGKLKCVFDAGNFVLKGFQPYPYAYNILKNYIEYFHIKDALRDGTIVPCGEGNACITEILTAYKNDFVKKDTFVSLEPHLMDFSGLSDLALHKLKQKKVFENQFKAFEYAVNNLKNLLKLLN